MPAAAGNDGNENERLTCGGILYFRAFQLRADRPAKRDEKPVGSAGGLAAGCTGRPATRSPALPVRCAGFSTLLGGPHAGNDWYEIGGTRRGFAKGQTRARHEDSPKGGEFRAWHGFAASSRLGIFVAAYNASLMNPNPTQRRSRWPD
ncbi:hypothetical protein SBA3_660021 [Candidatus Sulfopaludibacter sp. SbA3]|nr:hypothetical protein SBA3_660021 [Candidatus Sulfopaludibacter sp. SbA3]